MATCELISNLMIGSRRRATVFLPRSAIRFSAYLAETWPHCQRIRRSLVVERILLYTAIGVIFPVPRFTLTKHAGGSRLSLTGIAYA
jgi:hypothetical protein